MRYSADHKQESRRKVLAAAARAIREQGPEGVSVAAVMAEAGLTHGGFYAHFPSKSALVAAAIDTMFEESAARLDKLLQEKGARAALNAHIDYYLSARHCETLGAGCPFAALGSDVPRLDSDARAAFARGLARRQQWLTRTLRDVGVADPEAGAHSLHSELLGALMSARWAMPDQREALLASSRHAIQQRFGLQA